MNFYRETDTIGILGTNAIDISGIYLLWLWGVSDWNGNDIFLPYDLHEDCILSGYTTTSGGIKNIFVPENTIAWVGNGPLKIKYPYSFRLKTFGIYGASDNIDLYGSNVDSPDEDVVEYFNCDEINTGTFTNCIYNNKIELNTPLGEWVSPSYEIDATNIFDFRYSGNIPSGCLASFYFRTSNDNLNWTEWTKDLYNIDNTITINNTNLSYYFVPMSININNIISDITIEKYIKGTVNIYGTALSDNFHRYTIEIGEGYAPIEWATLIDWVETSVDAGILGSFDTTAYDDGIYTLKLTVEDNSEGGPLSNIDSVYCYIDNTNPIVTITSPTVNKHINNDYIINGIINDDTIKTWCLYFYASGESPNYTNLISYGLSNVSGLIYTLPLNDYTDGNYTLTIIAYDMVGNSTTVNVNVVVDSNYPCILSCEATNTIISYTRGINTSVDYIVNANTNLTATVYDEDDVIIKNICTNKAISTSGIETWDGRNNSDEVVTNGSYYIVFNINTSGNTDSYTINNIIVNNTAPIVTISIPTDNTTYGNFIEIIGTVSDVYFSSYDIEYYHNSVWIKYGAYTSQVTSDYLGGVFLANGTYKLRIKEIDTGGNIKYSSEINVIIIDIPEAEISLDEITYTELCNMTITLVDFYSINNILYIPQDLYTIYNTLVIRDLYSIDNTITINEDFSYNISQIIPKKYIQIKCALSRPGSESVYISAMNFFYSNDWFLINKDLVVSGITLKQLYSEYLKHLCIIMPNNYSIYEIAETKKI
jgi:hypothetical protein